MASFSFASLLPRLGLVFAAALCFTARSVAVEPPPPPAELAFTLAVPGNLSVQQVHDIVVAASLARGWQMKEDTKTRVVIYLNHRKNEATVTYLITEKTVTAYCEGYATDGKGVRKGPEQPRGWLKYLNEDITKGMDRLGRGVAAPAK